MIDYGDFMLARLFIGVGMADTIKPMERQIRVQTLHFVIFHF